MIKDLNTQTYIKWISLCFAALLIIGVSGQPKPQNTEEKKRYYVPNISVFIQPVEQAQDKEKEQRENVSVMKASYIN